MTSVLCSYFVTDLHVKSVTHIIINTWVVSVYKTTISREARICDTSVTPATKSQCIQYHQYTNEKHDPLLGPNSCTLVNGMVVFSTNIAPTHVYIKDMESTTVYVYHKLQYTTVTVIKAWFTARLELCCAVSLHQEMQE